MRLFGAVPTHFVFGNCDRDRAALRAAMAEAGATLHEPFGSLELGGRQIAWTHGDVPSLARDVIASAHFDFVFYGHTHWAEEHREGPTRVVNPGALHRADVKSFAVLDPSSGELETVRLG